jgi:hypothetical protein
MTTEQRVFIVLNYTLKVHIRELKIYDAADSTTRLQKKEICDARQTMWIICGPRRILNDFVMLSTTLN